jgi:hypothetical protein
MWWELGTCVAAAVGFCASVCVIWEFFRRRGFTRSRITDEFSLICAADHLIQVHGSTACHRAAMRALALYDQGDVEGFHAWKLIAKTIDERSGLGGQPM